MATTDDTTVKGVAAYMRHIRLALFHCPTIPIIERYRLIDRYEPRDRDHRIHRIHQAWVQNTTTPDWKRWISVAQETPFRAIYHLQSRIKIIGNLPTIYEVKATDGKLRISELLKVLEKEEVKTSLQKKIEAVIRDLRVDCLDEEFFLEVLAEIREAEDQDD